MLKVTYNPINDYNSDQLTLTWNDPVLTVNGTEYDLSELDDGDIATHEVLTIVSRELDDYGVTLFLPHGKNAPVATRYPTPIEVTTNGIIDVPDYGERM